MLKTARQNRSKYSALPSMESYSVGSILIPKLLTLGYCKSRRVSLLKNFKASEGEGVRKLKARGRKLNLTLSQSLKFKTLSEGGVL